MQVKGDFIVISGIKAFLLKLRNGKVISFGWNSGGIGKKNGFEIEKILLVNHGSQHNDTICTLEVKATSELALPGF